MVHNGIEYGIMQLISEAYDLMKNGLRMNNQEMKSTFGKWNQGRLSSYLVEITADILGKEDEEKKGYLIDHILDSAGQKGTGKWTSQLAMDLGVPLPTVDAALSMRYNSAFKKERRWPIWGLKIPTANGKKEPNSLRNSKCALSRLVAHVCAGVRIPSDCFSVLEI